MSNIVHLGQLVIPPNALTVISGISNVSNFTFTRSPEYQRIVTRLVFEGVFRGKLPWVKTILFDISADMTAQVLFFGWLAVFLGGARFKRSRTYCEKKKKDMMWNGWIRAKISCYLPTTILVLAQYERNRKNG